MDTRNVEISNRNMLLKKLTKSELTEKFWERDSEYCLKKLPAAYRDKSFSDLEGETKHKIIEKLKKWNIREPLVCSILSNQNGIGKTHLAVAYIKEMYFNKIKELEAENYKIYLKRFNFLENHKEWKSNDEFQNDLLFENNYLDDLPSFNRKYHLDFKFISERKLLMEYRSSLDYKSTVTEEDFLNEYSGYDLLVIDDIFSSKEGNFEQSRSVLFSILDERMTYQIKPTILTSNLMLEEIAEKIDTRISSRMDNSMLIPITTKMEDFRGRI